MLRTAGPDLIPVLLVDEVWNQPLFLTALINLDLGRYIFSREAIVSFKIVFVSRCVDTTID